MSEQLVGSAGTSCDNARDLPLANALPCERETEPREIALSALAERESSPFTGVPFNYDVAEKTPTDTNSPPFDLSMLMKQVSLLGSQLGTQIAKLNDKMTQNNKALEAKIETQAQLLSLHLEQKLDGLTNTMNEMDQRLTNQHVQLKSFVTETNVEIQKSVELVTSELEIVKQTNADLETRVLVAISEHKDNTNQAHQKLAKSLEKEIEAVKSVTTGISVQNARTDARLEDLSQKNDSIQREIEALKQSTLNANVNNGTSSSPQNQEPLSTSNVADRARDSTCNISLRSSPNQISTLGEVSGPTHINSNITSQNFANGNNGDSPLNTGTYHHNLHNAVGTSQSLLNELTPPSFCDEGEDCPLTFIRELEDYFSLKMVPETLKLHLARKQLRGRASEWGRILFDNHTTYSVFKQAFLSHYWGTSRQTAIRQELLSGRYDPSSGMTMQDYLLRVINRSRLIEPSIGQREMIQLVTNHFPPETRNFIRVAGVATYTQLMELLSSLEGHSPRGGTDGRRSPNHNGSRRRFFDRRSDVPFGLGAPISSPGDRARDRYHNQVPHFHGEERQRRMRSEPNGGNRGWDREQPHRGDNRSSRINNLYFHRGNTHRGRYSPDNRRTSHYNVGPRFQRETDITERPEHYFAPENTATHHRATDDHVEEGAAAGGTSPALNC